MEPGVFISRCFFFTLGDFDVREICNEANCIFTARITVHYLHTDRARTSTSYTWCICDRDGSKPRYAVFKTQICSFQNADMQFSKPRYAVFKTQICSFQNADMQFTKRIFAVFKTRICSLQNAHLQFTERRRSFQNIPVLPPSHDRLNSATFPRAGIVFVALSSRRLYSIPRPYMRSSFTGCFNTCVFHTNLCPCLCSFLACFLLFAQVSKHKHKIQNTNAGFKKQVQNIYKGLLAPTCRIQTKTGSIKVNLMSGKPKARKLIVRSCVTWSQNHPAFFLIRDIKLRTLVGHRCPVGTPVYRNNL